MEVFILCWKNLIYTRDSVTSLNYASAKETAYLVLPQKYLTLQHSSFIPPVFHLQ